MEEGAHYGGVRSAWGAAAAGSICLPRLMRTLVLETVSGADGGNEGRVGNGIETSRGTAFLFSFHHSDNASQVSGERVGSWGEEGGRHHV